MKGYGFVVFALLFFVFVLGLAVGRQQEHKQYELDCHGSDEG